MSWRVPTEWRGIYELVGNIKSNKWDNTYYISLIEDLVGIEYVLFDSKYLPDMILIISDRYFCVFFAEIMHYRMKKERKKHTKKK